MILEIRGVIKLQQTLYNLLVIGIVAGIVIIIVVFLLLRKKAGESNRHKTAEDELCINNFPPTPGASVGEWVIEAKLKESNLSISYLARGQNKSPVVLKIPQARQLRNEEYMTRFRREAEILKKLQCPNIVRLQKTGVLNSKAVQIPYMILDYVEGKDLGLLMVEETRPSPGHAIKIVRGIANALDVVHNEGIIHRNIKPTSIRLSKEQEVILLNFGIAKIIGAETITQVGAALGTTMYMAPEQMGDEKIDSRVDLYALGVIFYRLLTGQFPFDATNVPKLIENKLKEDPTDPCVINPSIPRAVADIAMKLLKRNREERYDSAASLIADLNSSIKLTEDEPAEKRDEKNNREALPVEQKAEILTDSRQDIKMDGQERGRPEEKESN